jgi:hypothetical protein
MLVGMGFSPDFFMIVFSPFYALISLMAVKTSAWIAPFVATTPEF